MKDRFIFDLLHLKKILHICVIFLCNIAWNSLRDLFDVFTKHKNRNTSYIFHPIAMLNSNQINLTSIEDKTICTFTKKVYQKDHLAHWFFFHCKNNNLIMLKKNYDTIILSGSCDFLKFSKWYESLLERSYWIRLLDI